MRATMLLLIGLTVLMPAIASQPGQPLDCSDWVFLEPGLSCQVVIPPPCGDWSNFEPRCVVSHDGRALDNQGRILREQDVATSERCGNEIRREEILVSDSLGERVIAYITDRCVLPEHERADIIETVDRSGNTTGDAAGVRFDPVAGRLLFTIRQYGRCNAGPCPPGTPPDYDRFLVIAITGFPTLFEIQQGYSPTSGIGFRVPIRPEGLQAAESFSTYWGRVEDLPYFDRATAMACNYPSDHAPQPGEYLSVPDTSPTPNAGHANYTVTAVTGIDGERRYGRQRIDGNLSGRDPRLLPACSSANVDGAPTPPAP